MIGEVLGIKICTFNEDFIVFVFVLLMISSTYSELITLGNTTHIHCIDDDNESPTFTLPPLDKMRKNLDFLKDVMWDNDDWTAKTSTDIPISAVTDKRWEDFTLVNTDYHRFNISNSRSVSVLSPAIIEIFARNDNNGIYKLVELNENEKWYHFSVISKSNRVLFYKNDEVVRNETDLGYTDVVFKSRNITFWKVHEYNLKWSNKPTENIPTTITVPLTEKPCLLLYTALCNDCTLKVNTTKETKIVYSKNKETTDTVYWQTDKIEIEPNPENNISLYRKHNGNGDGYWAIDFRLCDSKNIVSYRKPSEAITTNYTCGSLHTHRNNKKLTTSASCDVGKFGSKCQYSCDEIFEQSDDNLCYSTIFFCGWGRDEGRQYETNNSVINVTVILMVLMGTCCSLAMYLYWRKRYAQWQFHLQKRKTGDEKNCAADTIQLHNQYLLMSDESIIAPCNGIHCASRAL